MNQSSELDKLACAISAFQGEMAPVLKDETNPFFKSKYADLNACWRVIRAPLTKHGLAVTQFPCILPDGSDGLKTTIFHVSGQFQSEIMRLYLPKQDPQGQGSAISYARRYALSAALGLSSTDDDAEAAVRPSTHNTMYGGVNDHLAANGELTIPQRKEAISWFRDRVYNQGSDWYCDMDEAQSGNGGAEHIDFWAAVAECRKELGYTEQQEEDIATAVFADWNETKRRQSARAGLLCTEQQRANLLRDGLRMGWSKDQQSEWLRNHLQVAENTAIKTKLTIQERDKFIKHMEQYNPDGTQKTAEATA